MKRLIALTLLATLAGCKASHSLQDAATNSSQAPLPVLYVTTQGNVPGEEWRNLIRATGVFRRVEPGPAPADAYAVNISSVGNQSPDQERSMGNQGFVQQLLDNSRAVDTQLTLDVSRGAQPLKQYQYRNRSEYKRLGASPQKVRVRNEQIIINNFIADLQRDQLIQPADHSGKP